MPHKLQISDSDKQSTKTAAAKTTPTYFIGSVFIGPIMLILVPNKKAIVNHFLGRKKRLKKKFYW